MGYNEATAADGRGGGIYVLNGGVITLSGWSNVYKNSAYDGAGVYADDARVELPDAIIHSNTADHHGGGVYLANGSTLDASGNTSIGYGVEGMGNEAVYGGGLYVDGSTVDFGGHLLYNNATEAGGGIFAQAGTINVLDGAVLEDNRALNAHGGAIYLDTGTLDVAYGHLHDNTAQRGGAIYQAGGGTNAQISNSLIHGNTSSAGYGAGIRTEGGAFAVTHATLANNLGGAGYSQANTTGHVTNSIAWGNAAGGFWNAGGTLGGTCNIDQSGNVGSNSNPRFVDAAGGDFRLLGDSTAIDACTTGLSPDLDGRPRPFGSGYDMGAYEFYVEYTVEAVVHPVGGGTVSGTGTYTSGSTATVNASPEPGFVFVHWTEGSTIVSCNAQHSFTVSGDRTLQATFSPVQAQYDITGTASPPNHGTVVGAGSYTHGAAVTMTALPRQGFRLVNWIETWPGVEGYCVVSTEEEYSFSASRDRDLTANLRPRGLPGVMMLLLGEE